MRRLAVLVLASVLLAVTQEGRASALAVDDDEQHTGRDLLVAKRNTKKRTHHPAPKNPQIDPLILVPPSYMKTLSGVPMSAWHHFATTAAFRRSYASKKCKWIYFTTLKTASMMTREAMMIPKCGYEPMQWLLPERGLWFTCGSHDCEQEDLLFAQKDSTYKIVFVREPMKRALSVWNYVVPVKHSEVACQKHCSQEKRTEMLGEYLENYLETIKDMKHVEKFSTHHFQPQFLFTCVLGQCLHGNIDFVGRAEKVAQEVSRLNATSMLGGHVPNSVLERRHFTNPDRNKYLKIEKGTKLPDRTVLAICTLYWNDYMCFGYDLPEVCEKELDFPKECFDLQGNTYEPYTIDDKGIQRLRKGERTVGSRIAEANLLQRHVGGDRFEKEEGAVAEDIWQ